MEVVQNDAKGRRFPRYDILVIDESQDIDEILYSFVSKVMRDHIEMYSSRPQLMIIGKS